jgi:hypothetical protein
MAHWLGLNLLVLGYVFPTKEMRGEKERERAQGSKWLYLPSLKPLGSIYRGGRDDSLHFISLMG